VYSDELPIKFENDFLCNHTFIIVTIFDKCLLFLELIVHLYIVMLHIFVFLQLNNRFTLYQLVCYTLSDMYQYCYRSLVSTNTASGILEAGLGYWCIRPG